MKRRERERKEEDSEIILFFNHNYDILPLTFKKSTFLFEALTAYIEKSNKRNPKFKFGDKELKLDLNSGKILGEIEGLVNGAEITVSVE